MDKAILREVKALGSDIIASERFAKARLVPHHSKDGNIAHHSLETAGYALMLVRWLEQHGVSVSERDAVRASLLHDIGMTEESVFFSPSHRKGRTHPKAGAHIARVEFEANSIQIDAILHHMWPVCTLVPPRTAVGWVVTLSDKCCSVHEVGRTSEQIVEAAGRWLLRMWRR